MHPPIPDLSPDIAEVLQAGRLLGENQTFGLISGRCSAAQAEALLRLRESRCYLRLATTWREFCPRFLNISYSRADRIIRCWQEFGPGFFELQRLISISPEVYRSIEPAIQDGALHFKDEAIDLDPENSRKVVAAVTEPRSVVLSSYHSGSLRYYGGRMTLQFTALDAGWFGVDQARRGWLEAGDVINTRPLTELRKLLKR